MKRYRDEVTVTKRGREQETYNLNAFLHNKLCSKPLSSINRADFVVYRDERLKTIKPATFNRQIAPIHHLFDLARKEWGLPVRVNPVEGVQLKGFTNRRERRLRTGELERLLEAARKRDNPYIAPIICLAVETGMRRGELLAIKVEHVDWDRRSLLIPEAKNGQARVIPLTKTALAVIEAHKVQSGRLFPISANAFRLAWQRIKRQAGIADLRFHDLRHEAVSTFFEKGLTVPEVASISGHKDARMLFRYAHARSEAILAKLDV